jgi:arylsulfatase A-like enzyme
MGLERGFRIWDGRVGGRFGAVTQDRAGDVVLRAEDAIDRRQPGTPLFLFVHFYDPHQPYDPPEPFHDRYVDPAYAGPYTAKPQRLGALRTAIAAGQADAADVDHVTGLYLGEVAYTDDAIGHLLAGLERRGLLKNAIVVVTADHGEVLSESKPYAFSHGTDVSDGVMRVPLIVAGYGVPIARGRVVRRQAEMAGLAPTIQEMVGLEPTLGASFATMLSPGPVRDDDGWPERPTRPVVMEATRPHREEIAPAWNNLDLWRGVKAGGWTVTSLPRRRSPPALVAGPGGRPSTADAEVGSILAGRLAAWDAAAPAFRDEDLDAETLEMLRALGYTDD